MAVVVNICLSLIRKKKQELTTLITFQIDKERFFKQE